MSGPSPTSQSDSAGLLGAPKPSGQGAGPKRSLGSSVSPWWRILAVALVIVLVIVGLSVTVFLRASPGPASSTEVEWFSYEIPGGPGVSDNGTNFRATEFCAPSNAITVPIFSLIWNTSTGKSIQQVRLWTVLPVLPQGKIVNLYEGTNSSGGGTSFLSTYPDPCGQVWSLDVESNTPVIVLAIATLTYNYTS
jgi:hypothetical protein